jgi:sporulation protein YlmC with PRC-barrel domain
MDSLKQFQRDAMVLAADGQQIGSLSRVVVNPETGALTDILVKSGALFNQQERVIPVEYVAETSEDWVILRHSAGLLNSFPLFEEHRYVDAGDFTDDPSSNEHALPTIYGHADIGLSVIREPQVRKLATQITHNIPDGAVAMKKGAKVLSAEGVHVGNVERVLADPSEDQVTHLLISSGVFSKEMRLVPIHWVMRMGGENIELRVARTAVDELADISLTE